MAKLLPCPFCGSEDIKLRDHTEKLYGFDGYELLCVCCKCRILSEAPHERYWENGKYCTPKTERAKKNALTKLYETWNTRAPKEGSEPHDT